MPGRTITRVDLANAVSRAVNMSRQDAQDLIDQFFDEIVTELARGEPVRLSSFGSFEVREKGERMGRNPKTGEDVPIASRRVVTFRSSDVMKRFINQLSDKV